MMTLWAGGPQRPLMLEGAAAARAAGAGNPHRDFGCAALLSRGKVLSLSFQGMVLLAGAGGSALWRTAVATVRPKNCCVCFFSFCFLRFCFRQVGAVTLSAAGMILLEMGAEGLAMA